MYRARNTKIIATLGPASSDPETIEKLFFGGVDVFRLNFSHQTHEDHKKCFDIIRALEKRVGHPIGIMQDLQGPKIRIASFKGEGVTLKQGQTFKFMLDEVSGDETHVHLPHPELFKVLEPGHHLLLDDGRVKVRITENDGKVLTSTVIVPGQLSDHKGVNIPDVVLPVSALTAKDIIDLEYGLKLGVDWVALSFVQTVEDIELAHKHIRGRASVLAKLEKPQAIENLDDIIQRVDAVLVARGDLGVEMLPEAVPTVQKNVVYTARTVGKPVVVATQMLDSMVEAPIPTRAEASDVANAVYEGADAVMLSAESATGNYPLQSVAMMDRIIKQVEKDRFYSKSLEASRPLSDHTTTQAITHAACNVVKSINAAAIVTFTLSGSTSLKAAKERPLAPIIGITPSSETARKLALVWGIYPKVSQEIDSFEAMVKVAKQSALKEGFASQGESLVITSGEPFGVTGSTNVLRIVQIDEGD